MIFNKEDRLYHKANNTCHICKKECINNVRECHETGKYRGPACNICNLKHKQENLFPLNSTTVVAMISIDYIVNCLHRIFTKQK